MRRLLLGVLLLGSCYAPRLDAGRFRCSDRGDCPEGHHCAGDGYCWANGSDPADLGSPRD